MLYFLKVYPKQGPGCLVVGASAGAADPKTHRKWVWAFIGAIAELVNVVASLPYFFCICLLIYYQQKQHQKGHRR